jgi:hypothetical protein
VPEQDGTTPAKVGAAGLVHRGVDPRSCRSGTPAGALDANGAGRPQAHPLLDRRLTG